MNRTAGKVYRGRVPLAVLLFGVLLMAFSSCGSGGNTGLTKADTGGQSTRHAATTVQKETVRTQQLSVKDAVGQMFIIGMSGTQPDYYVEKMIRERNIGGVILFSANMQTEPQTKELISSLQKLSMQTKPSIPLLVGVDQEGGSISHAPWVSPQPSAAEIGRRGDPAEAKKVAAEMGRQLRAAGVNTDFAPVVDTGSGAAIGDRSFGSDPQLVSRMGAAAISGFESARIVSVAKHFPNHGPADQDSHTGSPVINHDMPTILSMDLPPFEAAIKAGVPMVMVGHLIYPAIDPQLPASLSPAAMKLLRDQLRFKGVIVTDDLSMEGAKRGGTVAQAAVAAVSAGADMMIISGTPQDQADAYNAVVEAVESGRISRQQIDGSVRRIMEVKKTIPSTG